MSDKRVIDDDQIVHTDFIYGALISRSIVTGKTLICELESGGEYPILVPPLCAVLSDTLGKKTPAQF
jgi:hypothetical protein